MATEMRPLWSKEACDRCGQEGYATRTRSRPKSEPYVCDCCQVDDEAFERGRKVGYSECAADIAAYARARNYGDTSRRLVRDVSRGYCVGAAEHTGKAKP
jgi:hypothetical protein